MVRCNQYGVPARFIGHRLRVKLSASAVTVYDRNSVVARHQRAIGKGAKVLDLDHYLEICIASPAPCPARRRWCRPGQPRSSPPSTTRFGPPPAKHMVTRRARGRSSRCCCCTAISTEQMCSPGSPRPVGRVDQARVVALEARKAAERRGARGSRDCRRRRWCDVLAGHRWAAVAADERPLPSVDKYDILLGRETS